MDVDDLQLFRRLPADLLVRAPAAATLAVALVRVMDQMMDRSLVRRRASGAAAAGLWSIVSVFFFVRFCEQRNTQLARYRHLIPAHITVLRADPEMRKRLP